MMLQIAYLGEKFHGFAYQPGLRTVEGDLQKALDKVGLTPKVYVASRTDKGVSALCNVIQVPVQKENICRILTALLKDIWVYKYSLTDWNPRHCTKHYIYFLPGTYKKEDLHTCCSMFSGVHDFSSFSKGDYLNTKKEIQVSFEVKGDMTLLHFTGKSFLWEMIRRCVTGMKEYLSGRKTEGELSEILKGNQKKKVAPAPAENLLLADLIYTFPLLQDEFSFNKMREEFLNYYELYLVKKIMFEEILNLTCEKKEKKLF
jgi:tRNA pseudouridine38-40 synthase